MVNLTRQSAIEIVETELDYLDNDPYKDSYIQKDILSLGETISALEVKLQKARTLWYEGKEPYFPAMEEIRKIAALSIRVIQRYDSPSRNLFSSETHRENK